MPQKKHQLSSNGRSRFYVNLVLYILHTHLFMIVVILKKALKIMVAKPWHRFRDLTRMEQKCILLTTKYSMIIQGSAYFRNKGNWPIMLIDLIFGNNCGHQGVKDIYIAEKSTRLSHPKFWPNIRLIRHISNMQNPHWLTHYPNIVKLFLLRTQHNHSFTYAT